MAKKAYKVHDDLGRPWLVKPGDPAFPLVSTLKYPEPVLPFYTLCKGELLPTHLEGAGKKLRRLSAACGVFPEDEELAAALRRAVSLRACIAELVGATIASQQEA